MHTVASSTKGGVRHVTIHDIMDAVAPSTKGGIRHATLPAVIVWYIAY